MITIGDVRSGIRLHLGLKDGEDEALETMLDDLEAVARAVALKNGADRLAALRRSEGAWAAGSSARDGVAVAAAELSKMAGAHG